MPRKRFNRFCRELRKSIEEERDAGDEYRGLARLAASEGVNGKVKDELGKIGKDENRHWGKLERIYFKHCRR